MADIKIAGRIKAGAADGISGYASEILFDDQASNKTVKEKIEEVASSPQTMIVTISPDGNEGYEADKTFAEIKAFIDNGGTVIAKDEEDGDSYYYLDNYIASEVVFTRNIWGSGGFSTRYYTIDNTDTVSFIDSVHHISSAVNSSSTANLANSAAVKAVKDDLANYVKKNTNDDSVVYFRNHNGKISIDGDGLIEIDPNEQGDVQGHGTVMIYGDVIIPESATVGGKSVAVVDDIPDSLADLAGDSTHRTVTDAEKTTWSGKQNALTFDNVPTANSDNPVKSGGVYQAIQSIDVSSQISGKAEKSEMSVVAGTGANADKTTITLKSGTSATVLTQHQDVSGKEDKSNKVTSFSSPTDTQYPSAKLVNDQLATKENTISDLSTIRSGASAGATAYQKPGTGIPPTDLASAVQTSLGKADTAIQSVTVGTTTTGAAGSSASVTNTGTATEPVLSFTIPQGAQGIQGVQGIQGPQGEQGPKGDTGVTAEASDLVIKQAIDVEETYADTDIAGAETVKTLTKEDLSNEKVIAAALVELASKVDDGYTFKGLVTPADGVGTQIQKAAYVGMAGVYTNFSGNTFTVPSEHIGIFLWDGTSWSLSTKSIYLEDDVTITDFSDWTFGYLDGNGVINTTSYVKYNYLKVSSGQTITVNTCGASITIAKENNKALVTANKANNVLGTYSYTPTETCNLYVAVRVANATNQGTLIPPSITISSIVPPYMKKENVVPFGEGEEYNDVVSALSLKNKSIITEEDAKWTRGWMARTHHSSNGNASIFIFENDSYSYIYAKVKGYNQPTYWAMAFYSDSPSDSTLIKSFTFDSFPYENEWYIIKSEIPENCKYIYVHAGGIGLANVTSEVRIFREDSYLSLKDLLDNFQLVKDTTVFDGINFVPSMYDNYGRYIQIRNHIGKKKNVWNATATNSDFRCIFMSDIHAQESTFRRIVGLTNLWHEEGYVDALINSGDVAYDSPIESYTWYNNLRNECAVDVLTTPGNHDYIYSNQGSKELCYSNIIAPMVNGTTINSGEENETVVGQVSGIVQPEDAADEHRFYYYKDYNSVRVIAIYMKVDATEQLTWLEDVLADSITNSKHVIIINHSPFAPALALREYATAAAFFENEPNTFYSSTSIVPGYSSSGFTNSDTPVSAAYVAAVKEFEDAGGNFICWLSGHCHSDAFYDVTDHETYGYQLHLNTTCASTTMSSFDSVRVGSYGNKDSFNYLCVDTTKKVVEVLRIGNNTDIIGRSKIYFAYHYGLHKLIANY